MVEGEISIGKRGSSYPRPVGRKAERPKAELRGAAQGLGNAELHPAKSVPDLARIGANTVLAQ